MIKIFVKLYIIIFINVNISVVTTHYLCGKVEILKNKAEFVFSSAQIADNDNLLSRFCEICNRIKINS